jgi:aryl-alcohol dehydrogenase-like predicted oxidoreductase
LAQASGELAEIAGELGATAGQVALAWLLRRSPNIILIPGTTSIAHLKENVAAGAIDLSDAQFAALSGGG